MKLFADTANLHDIEEILKRGFIRGITTNPSLLAKEPKAEFKTHIKKIIALIEKYKSLHPTALHLSIEVFSRNPQEIIEQAHDFYDSFGEYQELSIKVQIGWNELEAIRKLAKEGYSVNCTCCMSVAQATLASAAGAKYVSLFYHRIEETPASGEERNAYFSAQQDMLKKDAIDSLDLDPMYVVRSSKEILAKSYPETEIIVGSLHSVIEVKRAGLMGAHICTVPPHVLSDMAYHFRSEKRIEQFFNDFQKWVAQEKEKESLQ